MILGEPIRNPNILLIENKTRIAQIPYSKIVSTLFGLVLICNFLNKLSIKYITTFESIKVLYYDLTLHQISYIMIL